MLKINDDLIRSNEKLVYSLIKKYSNNDNYEDLYQVGMLAIIKAAKKYDENSNVKFSTYAYLYVKGEILRAINSKSVKINKEVISNYIKIKKAKEYIYITYGKNVSSKELSALTGIEEYKIAEIENAFKTSESLESYINEDENTRLIDTIVDNKVVNINDYIELKDALKSLKEEEKAFIIDRYYNEKTQTEIAKEKNTSQVKIYRYERKVLDKLKDKIA